LKRIAVAAYEVYFVGSQIADRMKRFGFTHSRRRRSGMKTQIMLVARASVICCLVVALGTSQPLQAQSSIIQSSELREALAKASSARQKNLDQVNSFFESEPVRNALSKVGFDSNQLRMAAATLNADELAKIASRTQKAQADFAAGSLTNQQLTYIVIALATAVLVIILLKA
jgi:hypothetical protein